MYYLLVSTLVLNNNLSFNKWAIVSLLYDLNTIIIGLQIYNIGQY